MTSPKSWHFDQTTKQTWHQHSTCCDQIQTWRNVGSILKGIKVELALYQVIELVERPPTKQK